MFRTGRILLVTALTGMVVSTLSAGSAQAVAPSLASSTGPHCTVTADSPSAGQTTWSDSTTPTLTSVTFAHSSTTARPHGSVRITVKLSDDCSGAGDVVLELRNSLTHLTGYISANLYSSTRTSAALNDTWIVDLPLYGSDAGPITVMHVIVASGFTTATYASSIVNPTVDDPTYAPETYSDSDYHNLLPHKTTKILVKGGTTLTADGAPEPGHRGHAMSVTAKLKRLKTWTYAAYASQYVTVQYRSPGSSAWHTIKKVRTSKAGAVKVLFTPSSKGTYSFRAVFTGSTYVASATSATDSVKVS